MDIEIQIHVDVDAPHSLYRDKVAWIEDQIVVISDHLSPLPGWVTNSDKGFALVYTGKYESSVLALTFAKRIEALLQKHFGKAMHGRARIQIINR